MDAYFIKFIETISLTKDQGDDAITKYLGICKSINSEFYDSEYSDSVKFLFGSYKKKTTISHPEKDVDVIFMIPKEKFEEYQKQENGPSNLLTKVKNTLKDTYPTTDKIKNWTKVVLVDFATFKVEVLPAFEKEDGKFIIPNTGEGEDWIIFDPRSEIENFEISNTKTDGLTRDLIKIIKKWKIVTGNVKIKTYILDTYIINFLNHYSLTDYPKLIYDFFEHLHEKEKETYTETAKDRAERALIFYEEEKIENAVNEYIKIFGDDFPKLSKILAIEQSYIPAPNEEFIGDLFEVTTNKGVDVKIETYCTPQKGGFMHSVLLKTLPMGRVTKKDKLEFRAKAGGINGEYITKWKVRNFGDEANTAEKLRGEILDDNGGDHVYIDCAAFYGEHFIECYIIHDNMCIATSKIKVPISNI